MNEYDDHAIETLATAWTVETPDLSKRVSAAIGAAESRNEGSQLLDEIRELRKEMESMRQVSAVLQEEILRLRLDLAKRAMPRIAPYSPAEGLIRLS